MHIYCVYCGESHCTWTGGLPQPRVLFFWGCWGFLTSLPCLSPAVFCAPDFGGQKTTKPNLKIRPTGSRLCLASFLPPQPSLSALPASGLLRVGWRVEWAQVAKATAQLGPAEHFLTSAVSTWFCGLMTWPTCWGYSRRGSDGRGQLPSQPPPQDVWKRRGPKWGLVWDTLLSDTGKPLPCFNLPSERQPLVVTPKL